MAAVAGPTQEAVGEIRSVKNALPKFLIKKKIVEERLEDSKKGEVVNNPLPTNGVASCVAKNP